jgi:hypothetical protein
VPPITRGIEQAVALDGLDIWPNRWSVKESAAAGLRPPTATETGEKSTPEPVGDGTTNAADSIARGRIRLGS